MGDSKTRHLVLVLGDQLDHHSAVFDGFDNKRDAVWMAENHREATHVWCHKLRLAFFFSAMRHFRDELRERGRAVCYHELARLKSDDRGETFAEILRKGVHELRPEKLIVVEPGDHRVWEMLDATAQDLGVELDVRPDRHFYDTIAHFKAYADGRKELRLENYYRMMRKRENVLLTKDGEPVGGSWNYDQGNRETFGKKGPGHIKPPRRFQLDDTTEAVIEMVESRFGDHPGPDDLRDAFDFPVTHDRARLLLRDFIKHRLPDFGRYEDAMWAGEDFLYHSRLSAALNVKLIDPRSCVDAAIRAHEQGDAPINSVEGFVRQLLGWREFIRGVYWSHMPDYVECNALGCDEDAGVPVFFWDGEADMDCVRHCMRSVINHAYAHHIPRLMVLGQLALLLGVHPRRFHDWHMAMYADAIDWVSLPNTLGMSQYGDGGIVGTKPYCASGNYINKMSNYCAGCRYNPKQAVGNDACPFTTLYWDFLDRHHQRFSNNPRMTFQIRNLDRKREDRKQMKAIRERADRLKREWIKPRPCHAGR